MFKLKFSKKETELKPPVNWSEVKNGVLAKFPSALEKEVKQRVETFFQEEGLEMGECVVVDRNQVEALNIFMKKSGVEHFELIPDEREGTYVKDLNMSFVIKNKKINTMNHASMTEGIVVHELAHQSGAGINENDSSLEKERVKQNNPRQTFRCGFAFSKRRWGWLLEEGWADVVRQKYILKHPEASALDAVKKRLELPTSISPDFLVTITNEDSVSSYKLPIKYLFMNHEGKVIHAPSAIAAYCVELLQDKITDIFELLKNARKSTKGKRELASKLNAIHPHLYSVLQRGDYEEKDFLKSLNFVKEHAKPKEKVSDTNASMERYARIISL